MADDFLERFLGPKAATPNPVEAVRRATKRVLPKRFWRSVTVLERAGGFFGIALDGKPTKTPRGNALAVPSRLLAEALVAEWAGLGEEFDPGRMPLTRLLHRAIDDVAQNPGRVAAEIVKYAGSDLLCYRDADNACLGAREAAHWDAPLAWAHEALGARFDLAAGVKFIEQPKETLAAVARVLAKASIPFGLAALHSATTLTGSAILALALSRGRLSPGEAWAAAHVDEDFQIEAWGADQEAMARRAAQRTEFDAAALLLVAIDSA